MNLEQWFKNNTFHHERFSNIEKLVRIKEKKDIKISVVFPTFNEEETIASEILIIKMELMEKYKLVDEIAVIDSGSKDRTREIAHSCGADVYLAEEILKKMGSYRGKGENLWKALYVVSGDIIVYIDADIKNIHPKFVYGLVGPLLEFDNLKYVKAFYERPMVREGMTFPSGGGRVTQILIRPLFNIFFPEFSLFIQPLSGEYAGRREILEKVPFYMGYGVETGLLIDISQKFGLDCIAQVDLDKRVHRNQRLPALGRMSYRILQTILHRANALNRLESLPDIPTTFTQMAVTKDGAHKFKKFEIESIERPPMISVKEYQKKQFKIIN